MKVLGLYNILAVAACAGLGYVVYLESERSVPSLPAVSATAEATEQTAKPDQKTVFRMPPKNAFKQLATRPPFSPTRRPPRAKPPEPAPEPVAQKPQPVALEPEVAKPQITLVGILINQQKRFAMVRKPGVEELLRLGNGEHLDGWRVEGVLPDRLLLSHQGKLLEFELSEAARRAAAPAPVPANQRPRRRRQ